MPAPSQCLSRDAERCIPIPALPSSTAETITLPLAASKPAAAHPSPLPAALHPPQDPSPRRNPARAPANRQTPANFPPRRKYSDAAGPEIAKDYQTLIFLAGSASAEFFADIALCPFEAVKARAGAGR